MFPGPASDSVACSPRTQPPFPQSRRLPCSLHQLASQIPPCPPAPVVTPLQMPGTPLPSGNAPLTSDARASPAHCPLKRELGSALSPSAHPQRSARRPAHRQPLAHLSRMRRPGCLGSMLTALPTPFLSVLTATFGKSVMSIGTESKEELEVT